ncbi:hypothetical protein [Methanofollis liminatans]|uniref:hypothetical protein n=1 Tax=Methanofollis liminatans TaxID=2201 RepID=UPI00064EDE52|nr:hypothetical protein [Methanofollis liminatans]
MARRRHTTSPGQSPETKIFFEGLCAGIFAGIALKTGIQAEPEAIVGQVFETTVEVCEESSPESDFRSFRAIFAVFSAVIAVIGVIEIFTMAWSAGSPALGIVLFVIGFLIGCVFIVAILH